MRQLYKLCAALLATGWIVYLCIFLFVPKGPRSVIHVAKWRTKSAHVMNVERTVNTVPADPPGSVVAKPLSPPDTRPPPPVGQIAGTDTKGQGSLSKKLEPSPLPAGSSPAVHKTTKQPLQHSSSDTEHHFPKSASNAENQSNNVIPLETTTEFANPRTPVSELGSINHINRIIPERIHQGNGGEFQEANDMGLLPSQKLSTFSTASIISSSQIDEIVHKTIESLNETLLQLFENDAVVGSFNGGNAASKKFGQNETFPTSDAVDAESSRGAEGGNIHDPTKTEQLDTIVTPVTGQRVAPNVSMDYSDLHDKFLVLYLRFQGMNVSEGLGRRQPMRMTDVEERYLATPALRDLSSIPDEMASKVQLVSPRDFYQVGDRILLRVDLYDQRGNIRTEGGDEVRIWLKDPEQGHSTAAEVTDLGNGSYTGEATLKWTGLTQVRASLAYSREFLRMVIELRHGVLSTRWIIAKFSNKQGNVSEITPCLSSPPIPGYAAACNLTHHNSDVPWFCGQPTRANLTCAHLAVTGNLPFFNPLPLEGPALELNNRMNNRTEAIPEIPNDILIRTLPGPPSPQLPPCWTRPRRESWELPSQRGWLKAGAWYPDTCAIHNLNMDALRRCLRNTSLLLQGDSNMRMMFVILASILGSDETNTHWHAPIFLQVPRLNSSVLFAPHARPFNTGSSFGVTTLSVPQALQRLPQHHHYIIVLHYWLHFGFYPMAVFRDRVRLAKRAVAEFLETHPKAKVFLRGPHVVYDGSESHAQFGDKFGPWFLAILKEEFRDLYDRVWLLDFWPMTIASENQYLHPPGATVLQMLRVLFGYACETY